ncbi:hypothetical protein [Mycoplasmopsis gallinacea]|uniref:Uncharacterized protein n=1 Tax=Mycoplasmopsis gallinacea TaxID=29556 RepID=A0A6H0V3B8_9BACT|nr:hypothetical protein [Mycoplasmopsis gallinacea]QIW61966.1 hypothetical protein GOQ20_00565 [Mycoplasmopsis gallinacea]
MKNKLILISEPISNLTNLVSVVSNNINNTEIRKPITPETKENEQTNISEFLLSENLEVFEKIQKDLLDDKISSTKLSKNINDNEIKKIVISYAEWLYKTNKISFENFKKIENSISDELFSKFRKEIKKFSLEQKKEFQKNKELTKQFKENLRREFTDKAKNYKVNIISDEINSKQIGIEFFELQELLKQTKEIKQNISDQLIELNKLLKKLMIGSIVNSVATIVVTGLSMFFPFLGIVTVTTSIISIGLSIAISNLKTEINKYTEKLKIYTNLFKNLDNKIHSDTPALDAWNYIWSTVYGIAFGKVSYLYSWSSTPKDKFIFTKWSEIPKFAKVNFIFAAAGESVNIAAQTIDIIKTDGIVDKLNNFDSVLVEKMIGLGKRIESLKEFEWVVINESEQTDYYYNGGKGGKNLVFKNLQTGDEKTIDEMLEVPDWQLYKWHLTKVYNTSLKEWYIRKLPNSKKEDNLG